MACERTTFRKGETIIQAEWCNQVDATIVDALACAATPAQVLSVIGAAAAATLDAHVKDKANPHSVSAAQAGALPDTSFANLSKIEVVEALPLTPNACTLYVVVGAGNVPTC